jgi:hypothetical protein
VKAIAAFFIVFCCLIGNLQKTTNNKKEMATFKKTLETWYKEMCPGMNLVQELKHRDVASAIIAAYLLDEDVVEYTTEYGKGLYVYASENFNDPLETNVRIHTMHFEQLYDSDIFSYSIAAIDLGEIQRKLENTVINVCKRTDWGKKKDLEENRKKN